MQTIPLFLFLQLSEEIFIFKGECLGVPSKAAALSLSAIKNHHTYEVIKSGARTPARQIKNLS
jgi:hypothetical protein